MNQTFDYFGRFEKPTVVLCNPDRSQLYAIGDIYDTQMTLRYNALSEFSFTVPRSVSGSPVAYYSLLEYPRKVFVDGVGYFVITGTPREDDGVSNTKQVTCYSDEWVFSTKKITLFEGTFKFYDAITPSESLLGKLIAYVPGWSVGTVDASLLNKYRTFNVTDNNIYNFMMEEVEQKYQCIFEFDTIGKTVNAVVPTLQSTATDIYLSHDNLLVKTSLTPSTEELITALTVYGAGNLTINAVNPLGTNTIYNFSYFESTDWMSASLVSALNAWEAVVDANQPTYAGYLTELRNLNEEMVALEGDLADLQAEWNALEAVRKARVEKGDLDLTDITAQCDAKQAEIDAKQVEIDAKQVEIDAKQAQLTAINTACSFATNFTQAQLDELQNFIFGSTYQNDAFLQTDAMNNVEIQDMAQNLYDQGQEVLAKVSTPRYTLEVDATNFIFLPEYDSFTDQLTLGDTMTVQSDEDTLIYPALLEIQYSYDDPNSFKLTFSNALRLGDPNTIFTDFYDQTQKSAISTSFNSQIWSNFQTNYQDDVSTFITSALDASLNNVLSSVNQEIKISENGLKGRRYLPDTETYSPEQIWLTSNVIAFTRDNWNTCSTALGKIVTSSGSYYGLVAEAIVGNLIAGNQLTIMNENNTFKVDGSGVTITNASVDVTTTNGNLRIRIDPTNGILLQKKSGVTWQDKFYADADGNLTLTGRLVAATGDFSGTVTAQAGSLGGITINSQGIQKDANNFIRSNGDFKWGMLTMTGGNAYFNGNIYADNLLGLIQFNQIGSVNADTITTGTLQAIDIYGCTISWPGVTMHAPTAGNSQIFVSDTLSITAGDDWGYTGITVSKNALTLRNKNQVTIGGLTPQTAIRFNGRVWTRDAGLSEGWGVSEKFTVKTLSGNKKLSFVNGLLVTGTTGGTVPVIDTFFTDFGFTVVIPITETGVAGHVEIPYDCRIDAVRMTSEISGSCVIDISLRSFDSFNELTDVSITGATPPTLSNAKTYEDTVLSGWTTTFSQGDYLVFDVESATSVESVNIAFKGKR